MKNKQVTKRTYSKDQLSILLFQEAFERDLPLFSQLVTAPEGLFGTSKLKPDWTYTVVTEADGKKKLIVNVPAKKA